MGDAVAVRSESWAKVDKLRWIGLISALLALTTTSYTYAWSLFVNPMIVERGASAETMALIYSVMMFGYNLCNMIGGKVSDSIGVRKTLIIAATCYAVGFALVGLVQTLWSFAIAFIVFVNLQNGFAYMAAYANIAKLFPDKKGLAMAIIGLGTTGGGMVISPVTQFFIDSVGMSMQFLCVGGILVAISVLSIILLVVPPKGYVPAGYTFEASEAAEADESKINKNFVQKDWKMMLRDPAFYLTVCVLLFGSIGSFVLTFQMSYVAQDVIMCTAAQSAFIISAVTGCNALGKLFWGGMSDKLGRLNLLPLLLIIETVCFAVLAFLSSGAAIVFIASSILVCFCSGGVVAFVGPLSSDLFGSKNFGFNFSIIMWGVAIASMISPWVANLVSSGTLVMFGICAGCCCVSACCALALRALRKNNLEIVYKAK